MTPARFAVGGGGGGGGGGQVCRFWTVRVDGFNRNSMI